MFNCATSSLVVLSFPCPCLDGILSYTWFVPVTWTKGGGNVNDLWLLNQTCKSFFAKSTHKRSTHVSNMCWFVVHPHRDSRRTKDHWWMVGGQHKYDRILPSQLWLWQLGPPAGHTERQPWGRKPKKRLCYIKSNVFSSSSINCFPSTGNSSHQPCFNYWWCL